MRARILVIVAVTGLAACSRITDPPGAPVYPELALVGEGLTLQRAPLPAAFIEPDVRAPQSLWSYNNQGLFHDLRARRVGDIVTVSIDIDDEAQFDNQSDRSRERAVNGTLSAVFGLTGFGLADASGDAAADLDFSGAASSSGAGSIDRSEKLHLSIAAVVTEVLPDGNLLISGSQEIRVNQEVRVLNIAGIVRPIDISSDNLIGYDKIAEARVSYGGRGKIGSVQ